MVVLKSPLSVFSTFNAGCSDLLLENSYSSFLPLLICSLLLGSGLVWVRCAPAFSLGSFNYQTMLYVPLPPLVFPLVIPTGVTQSKGVVRFCVSTVRADNLFHVSSVAYPVLDVHLDVV